MCDASVRVPCCVYCWPFIWFCVSHFLVSNIINKSSSLNQLILNICLLFPDLFLSPFFPFVFGRSSGSVSLLNSHQLFQSTFSSHGYTVSFCSSLAVLELTSPFAQITSTFLVQGCIPCLFGLNEEALVLFSYCEEISRPDFDIFQKYKHSHLFCSVPYSLSVTLNSCPSNLSSITSASASFQDLLFSLSFILLVNLKLDIYILYSISFFHVIL